MRKAAFKMGCGCAVLVLVIGACALLMASGIGQWLARLVSAAH